MTQESRRNVWRAALAGGLGTLIGLGVFTFSYAEGDSYLGNDPVACMNCHVMQEQFDGWQRSSHATAAVCNDCHAPHGNVVSKYGSKAINGALHSWAFTTGRFPDNIQIKPFNRRITENACRDCHQPIVQAIDAAHADSAGLACLSCHAAVGHDR